MIGYGSIPMSVTEAEAVERLLERQEAAGRRVSLARRDPGEQGPVVVEIDDEAWTVDAAGKARRVSG